VFDHRPWLVAAVLAAGVACLPPSVAQAGGKGLCATAAAEHSAPPYVAVVSAFPAELAPIAAATEIETTIQIAGRSYYVGRLGGVSVLLGLTGIGLVNATTRAHDLLAHGQIAGLVCPTAPPELSATVALGFGIQCSAVSVIAGSSASSAIAAEAA
jgi:Phosphorylase superfamily